MTPAERTLVVGVLDQHERRGGGALDRVAFDAAQAQLRLLAGRRRRSNLRPRPLLEQLADRLELFQHSSLAVAHLDDGSAELIIGALCAAVTRGARHDAQQDNEERERLVHR